MPDRRVWWRFSGELNVDYAHNSLGLQSSADTAFRNSLDSFVATWQDLFNAHSITAQVTSSRNDRAQGKSVALTGTVNFNLPVLFGVRPYVLAGGGHLFESSRNIVELQGNYEFTALNVPIRETTIVTLRYDSDGGMLGVVGGGLKRDISSRWGIRADVRAHIHSNRTRASMRSAPTARELSPEGGVPPYWIRPL